MIYKQAEFLQNLSNKLKENFYRSQNKSNKINQEGKNDFLFSNKRKEFADFQTKINLAYYFKNADDE